MCGVPQSCALGFVTRVHLGFICCESKEGYRCFYHGGVFIRWSASSSCWIWFGFQSPEFVDVFIRWFGFDTYLSEEEFVLGDEEVVLARNRSLLGIL